MQLRNNATYRPKAESRDLFSRRLSLGAIVHRIDRIETFAVAQGGEQALPLPEARLAHGLSDSIGAVVSNRSRAVKVFSCVRFVNNVQGHRKINSGDVSSCHYHIYTISVRKLAIVRDCLTMPTRVLATRVLVI